MQAVSLCVCLYFCCKQLSKPYHLALDVGCGSGQGTILLAPHFIQVVGTDVSPAMLAFAMASDHPPNIIYRSVCTEWHRVGRWVIISLFMRLY